MLDVSYIASVRQLLDAAGREMSQVDAMETPDQKQGSSVTIITGSTTGPMQIIGQVDNAGRDKGDSSDISGASDISVQPIPLLKRLEMQLNQAVELPSTQSVTGAVLDGEYSVHPADDTDDRQQGDD